MMGRDLAKIAKSAKKARRGRALSVSIRVIRGCFFHSSISVSSVISVVNLLPFLAFLASLARGFFLDAGFI